MEEFIKRDGLNYVPKWKEVLLQLKLLESINILFGISNTTANLQFRYNVI